ncbi:TonB-dependent receptor [Marinoscillum sp.]|uniref:TonB-dependent receptor n=1 Tax=Marinoscillum sp. TaxID=2024838 RepID=UPI003BAB8D2E
MLILRGVLFFLVVISFLPVIAQVSGVIYHKGESIPGATIQIIDSDIGTVSGIDGKFEIERLPRTPATLLIRSVGFKQKRLEVTNGAFYEVSLESSELGLDAVVVTGTMTPTMITASPVKVEVISSEHLNTYLPAAASSIMEGVKLINGVQEVVACGVCFTNSISINGLPGPYTAVLIDGSPMFGNLASVYGLNGIPNQVIDRFEVIKGPNSTLYGSEAMAGVINIITKDPANQPKFSIDLMGTTHLESFGNIGVSSSGNKWEGFTGLNYAIIGDFDDENEDGFSDLANLDRYSLFSKWSMERANGKQLTVAGKLYYEDRRNGVEKYLQDRNYRNLRGSDSIYGESIYTYRAELFGTYELPTSENLKMDYSASHHIQDSYYGADHYEAEQTIAYTNLVWNKQLVNHTLVGGLTNRFQLYDDNTVATEIESSGLINNNPDNQWIPGVFVQDEMELNEWFSLLAGLRLDHYSSHGFIPSPRLSTKMKLGDWTTLRSNFGTGFRVVNLFTEDHAFVTGQREVQITEQLKPERSVNGSLNLNHVFTIGNSQGMLDVDAYYSYFYNKIIPDYEQPAFIIYDNSSGYAVSKGLGFNWNQEFAFPLSYSIGGNLQRVTETEEGITRNVEFAANWSGVITANYNWKQPKMTIGYTLRVTGPMALPEVYDLNEAGEPISSPRPIQSEPFAFQNIQLTKQFSNQLSVYAGVQNLFNYVQNESPLVGFNDPNNPIGFSPYFDTSYAYSPIHGREFYLGVKWQID